MASVFKYEEFQGATGKWRCNIKTNLASNYAQWWMPARMLQITPAAYVQMLRERFGVDGVILYDSGFLDFWWEKEHYSKAHSFVLFINREARNRGFCL